MKLRYLLPKLRLGVAAVALLGLLAAAATAAFLLPGAARAQEEPEYKYIDLVMLYEHGPSSNRRDVVYRVQNNGTATATGVTVSFLLEGLEASAADLGSSITGIETVNNINQRLTWEIGTIPPGGITINPVVFSTTLHSNTPTLSVGEYRVGVINATASSIEPEPDLLMGNNVIKLYSFAYTIPPASSEHMSRNRLGLLLSVDDLRPDAGDDVTFSLTAHNFNPGATVGFSYAITDITIKMELSDGLEFSSGGQSITWRPDPVDTRLQYDPNLDFPASREIDIQARLTSNSLDEIPLRKRCITAWVENSSPPPTLSYALGSLKQCLGGPPVLLEEGSVAFLTSFPCIDDSHTDAHQCESVPGVAVAARLPSRHADYVESGDFDANLRSHGVGRTDELAAGSTKRTVFLDPESVFIQVKDPEGRVQDSHSHSVSDISWQTARKAISGKNRAVDGVTITYTRKDIKDKDAWNSLGPRTLTVTRADGTTPGKVKIRLNSSGNQFFDLSSGTATKNAFNITSVSTSVTQYFAEFETLGTYFIDYSLTLTDSSSNAYTDSGRYTFHVGPIAELEVRDGGASPHAAAGESALTIVALNNGPDTAPAARVTGLPTRAKALHTSQGSYDPDTGVWNLGELEDKDFRRATGRPEGATLVLSAADGDTAEVAIANSQDYQVCIDSSAEDVDLSSPSETACTTEDSTNTWHTTPYYDHIAGNNTAVITAARGTDGVGPGVPANPRAQTGATAVMWDKVDLLYGLPVERYEVQWLGNGWTTLDRAVYGTRYGDAAPSGRRDYRVRAVNAAGTPGPWSRSTATVQAGQAGPPVNLRAQADGNNAIDLFWDAPEDAGGSAVTGYTVQWSTEETGPWNNAGSATDLTFKHRGLQVGAVRWYRVAARNSGGLGHWSESVMGQTVSGVPDAPTLTARTLSDYEIELTWNQPKDNGQPITGYQVEFSSDGSAESWSRLSAPGADAITHTDDTLPANTRRYYRVRAVNSVGGGAWSRTVSAITQLTPPDAPSLTSVDADGPNAIMVTWREPHHVGDLSITQYQVQYAKNQYSEIWRGPATLSGSTRSWRHTGLKPGETWHYQVRASNGGGRWSPWSYSLSATTAADNAPKPVSGFSARYDKDLDQITLTWNDSSTSDATTWYELDRSEDGSDWRMLSSNPSCSEGKCFYADTDLWPGAKLYYRVRAANIHGEGPWSGQQSATRPPNPPGEPRINWMESDGSNHIVIEWEPPYDDGGADITGYRLLWCRALDGADDNPCLLGESNSPADPPRYSAISLGASARTYTHSVSPGYFYYYLLRATNGGNRWSEWQEPDIQYARTYAGVPSAPGLTARAVDSSQIKLTWTRPNSYGSEINSYWLYVYYEGDKLYDWDNILDVLTIQGSEAEYTIEGLAPETTRYFRIRALNDNGEGKYSVLRQATTPAN